MTHQTFFILHIAAGTIALLSGGASAFAEKGSKWHIQLGRLFAVTMIITAISAIVLSAMNPNPFLLSIGFFTLYLVGSGWAWVRRIPLQQRTLIGRYMGGFGILSAAYMLFVAFAKSGPVNVVLLAFAGILLSMAAFDAFRKKAPKLPAMLHGARMGGAYIAAFTAFIVVNVDLGIWGWLGPSVVGSPLIALGQRRYRMARETRKNRKQTLA